jgi:hypothetical protein
VAASPAGRLLAAFELQHNDGPWVNPDDYRNINGVVRYSHGDAVNGLTITGMAYHGKWNSTDQVPQRAIDEGVIGRFGALDATDGGDSYRYSGTVEWQRPHGNASTKVTAYGIGYNLNLFSNFTFSSTIHSTAINSSRPIIGSSPASKSPIGGWATG